MTPPHIVANQLKTLTPVGIPIIIVAAVKYALESTSNPTVNIWCAHTTKPSIPIDNIARTIL
jgi:cellobiose-specific phosphotransferase system component IIC